MSIVRVDRGRTHWYTIDGKRADGVTTLIGDGLPKPALTRWSSKTVAEYVADNRERVRDCLDWMDRQQLVDMLKGVPWSQRDQAAVKGTDVHGLAERLLHGEEVDVPDHLSGYVTACVRFLDDYRVEPVVSEVTVASRRYGYCGTLDLVGRLPDGRIPIADWKTARSGLWPETALQLAAYANAEVYLDGDEEKPVADLGITEGMGVWLRPDGYDVYPLDIGAQVFTDFLHIATVARCAKRRLKGYRGEPLPTPAWEVAS